MICKEDDIDFLKLSDRRFEELCFDLLIRLGYKGLVWRQGGPDSGRDIEGRLTVNNSLVDSYEEKWFFECKRYEKGIPPEAINSKIAWADAEKPKHFVIFASSYLSNNTRTWLEKISDNKPYIVHTIEGKQLKNIILGFLDIIADYFLDNYTKLLIDARKSWLIHDLLPDLDALSYLINNINKDKLDIDELAFLWCSAKIRTSEIDEWPDSSCKPFNTDSLFQFLVIKQNTSNQMVSLEDDVDYYMYASGYNPVDDEYPMYTVSRLRLNQSSNPRRALYSFVYDKEKEQGQGVEVLIEATGDFPTKVRYIAQTNIKEEEWKSSEIIYKNKYKT